MFGKVYTPNNREFMLYLTIKCTGRKEFRVWAETAEKKNSKYADRVIIVENERTIHFNFPYSSEKVFVGVLNAKNPKDTEFSVDLLESPLKVYNIWMDDKSKRFVKFAQQFTAQCGYNEASERGRVFKSPTDEFKIVYFDIIRDQKTGAVMNTPASIGHQSGKIFVAKSKFDSYTIAMRMIILLHEFSHKYKNPKIGLEISNEIGADINALYIYLGLGYSKVDAICVFANVFLKAQTPENIQRMRKINDYIQRFEKQEFAEQY